jgi:DNA-3-methyladenine glycosylase
MAFKQEHNEMIASQYQGFSSQDLITSAIPYEEKFYEKSATSVAKGILGSILVHEIDGITLAGFIVEAEAYLECEEACHAFRGRTPRTEVMFGLGGRAYIYFCYGMYWCLNVTAEKEGRAAAALIRAVEPISGISFMKKRRKKENETDLCSGPGKLTVAFALNGSLNGWDFSKPPLQILALRDRLKPKIQIVKTKRIGIKVAQDLEYRYHVKGNPHVSR